jgi:hypothetical protein
MENLCSGSTVTLGTEGARLQETASRKNKTIWWRYKSVANVRSRTYDWLGGRRAISKPGGAASWGHGSSAICHLAYDPPGRMTASVKPNKINATPIYFCRLLLGSAFGDSTLTTFAANATNCQVICRQLSSTIKIVFAQSSVAA